MSLLGSKRRALAGVATAAFAGCFALVALAPGALATLAPAPAIRRAGQQTPPAPAPPTTAPPQAHATIVVDEDTGEVLQAFNDRQPLRVASLAKILTALVVRAEVPLGTSVPISERAASMPALKINAKPGQVWSSTDLLWCLLLPSANDAAVALAEKAGGGNLYGFIVDMNHEAEVLGLADHPVFRDPAGLDGTESFDGGNYLSARDLAIAARAFLADPVLAFIVDQREYRFQGGDGLPHRIVGHNSFLTTYPGAIGVKTGYTEASGHSLVAAARRGDRTLVAVVIDSPDPDAVAASLLDQAFAASTTPAGTSGAGGAADRLPPRPTDTTVPAKPPPLAHPAALATPPTRTSSLSTAWLAAAAAALCVAAALLARSVVALHRRGMQRLAGPSRRRHPSWSGRRRRGGR